MDNFDRELSRRASAHDPEPFSAGLGLGLGFGMQSNTSQINNTMGGAQSQPREIVDQANESIPNASAPRCTSSSTFASIGPRPPNGLINAAATRGMFSRNIGVGSAAVAQRNNSHLSSVLSSPAMNRGQSRGQAGTRQSSSPAHTRSMASVRASSSSTSKRRVGFPTAMGLSGANAPTVSSNTAPEISSSLATSLSAANSATNDASYAPMGTFTGSGANGANTSAGLPSATSANNTPLNSAGYQDISNTVSRISQQHLPQPNNLLNGHPISTNNHMGIVPQLSDVRTQLTEQINNIHHTTNKPPMQDPKNPEIVAATTLHKFPKLPKEIQVKIWKLLIPGPRIIQLKREIIATTVGEEDENSEIVYERCVSLAPHPVLLHVCHDSRYMAKKIYKVCLEEELKWPVYMDPNNDVLLFPDTDALDVFALSASRADCSTPSSLAHIKNIIIDPKGVLAPLPHRPEPSVENRFPHYRLEEIAATYGGLRGIIVLKYPDNYHLAALPPQLNQAGILAQDETAVVRNYLSRLLQWSATMRRNGLQSPGGTAVPFVVPAVLPPPNLALVTNGGGGSWLQGVLNIVGGLGQGQGLPNGGIGFMNPLLSASMQLRTPWAAPKIVAMTLKELTERMENGDELVNEDDVS